MTQLSRLITVVDQASAPLQKIDNAAQGMARSVETADTRVGRIGQTFGQLEARVDPVAAAVLKVERATAALTRAQEQATRAAAAEGVEQQRQASYAALNQRARENAALSAVSHLAKEQQAAALARTGYGHLAQQQAQVAAGNAALAQSTRLTAREFQQLSPQIADVGVTLAGGMNPLMVLVQQGPQMVDAVGGISRAFELLRSVITPTRVAIAATAAAIGIGVVAAESQARAMADLSNRLRLTRGDYDDLARSIDTAARAAAASSSIGTGEARDAGRIITGSRNFSGSASDIQASIDTTRRLARAMGVEIPEAAQRLRDAFDAPTQAARRLADEGLRTMDEGLLRTIQRMENQGRTAEATRLVLDAYNRALGDMARSPWQQAISELGQAFTRLWQAIRPVAELIGGAVVSAMTGVVNLIARMLDGIRQIPAAVQALRDMVGGIAPGEDIPSTPGQDARRRNFGARGALGGFYADSVPLPAPQSQGASVPTAALPPTVVTAPAPTGQPQESALNRALRMAREINPRLTQRQDLQDRIAGLRAGLAGANPQQAAVIRDAIRELTAQGQGMAGASGQQIDQLGNQAALAGVPGAGQRELQQALIAARDGARREGGGPSGGQAAEITRLVRLRQNRELNEGMQVLDANTASIRAQIEALQQSGRAADDARLAHQARNEVMARSSETGETFERQVRQQTEALIAQRDAEQLLVTARENRQARDALDLRQRNIGASAVQRAMNSAEAQTRSRFGLGANDNLSPQQQAAVDEARSLGARQTEIERMEASFQELGRIGEQAFDRIGGAITQAMAQGRMSFEDLRNVGNAVVSELMQQFVRLAVINPLKNAFFGGNNPTLGDVGGILGSVLGIGGGGGGIEKVLLDPIKLAAGAIGLYHSGGVIGRDAPTFMAPVANDIFSTARRYHSGLMPDEFPAILQRGEGVFTPAQMAQLGPAGNTINMTVNFSGNAGSEDDRATLIAGIDAMIQARLAAAEPRLITKSYEHTMGKISQGGRAAQIVGRAA